MSKRDKKELTNRLAVLIMHLLKWQYQPEKRSKSWMTTINTQRISIEFLLKDTPGLKSEIKSIINKAFKKSTIQFEKETGINKKMLPNICPYSFKQLIDYIFYPK